MLKKLFIGGITGSIIYFLLEWVVYAVFLNKAMEIWPGLGNDALRTPSLFLPVFSGQFIFAILLTYVLIRVNTISLSSAIKTGAIIGLLVKSSIGCLTYGATTVYSN